MFYKGIFHGEYKIIQTNGKPFKLYIGKEKESLTLTLTVPLTPK